MAVLLAVAFTEYEPELRPTVLESAETLTVNSAFVNAVAPTVPVAVPVKV
jgi:hypothetical protein